MQNFSSPFQPDPSSPQSDPLLNELREAGFTGARIEAAVELFCDDVRNQPDMSDEVFFDHPVHQQLRGYLEGAVDGEWVDLPERVATVTQAIQRGTESLAEEIPVVGERAFQGLYGTLVTGTSTCFVTKHLNGAIRDYLNESEESIVLPFEQEVHDIALRVNGIRQDPRIPIEDRLTQIQARRDRVDLRGREVELTLEKKSQEVSEQFDELMAVAFKEVRSILAEVDPGYCQQLHDQCLDIFREPFAGFVDDAKNSLVERVSGRQNF